MTESDLKPLKLFILDKFKQSGWYNPMKGFLLSEDFDNIILYLVKRWEEEKEAFTPPISKMFRAFEECPFENLNVVIVGQDPYPQIHVADGISFSCSNSDYPQPSLRYILNAVNETVYNMELNPKEFDLDLKRWSNQGVLMLNTALTTVVGKPGKHIDLWKPFVNYLIDMLNNQNLIWVFLGKKAYDYEAIIDSPHKIFAYHPASAAYSGNKWDCNDLFNKVNKILETNDKKQIVW